MFATEAHGTLKQLATRLTRLHRIEQDIEAHMDYLADKNGGEVASPHEMRWHSSTNGWP
jgi:hypothetical protein